MPVSEDKRVATVRTFMTALQSGDLELAAGLMPAEFVASGLLTRLLSRNELLALQAELLAAMPDFSYNLTDVKHNGKDVQAFVSISGTQTEDLALPLVGVQSIAATGLAIDLPQTRVVYQVEEGLVLAMEMEQVVGGGLTSLLQQLGAELPLLARERSREDPSDPEESSVPPDIDK